MRVLIIEDDHATAQTIELMLKSEGFNCFSTDQAEEGVDLAKLYDYDIVLLDTSLPDMSGLEVLRQIRRARVKTPVVMLGHPGDSVESKVQAFGSGADDYVSKPFHKDELIARILAVIRRTKGHAQAIIHTGEIAVNLDARTVEVRGRPIHLTIKEYETLELLSLRKGAVMSKEAFLNHLYGGLDEPAMKIIDVFICKVRKKLRDAGADGHLRTLWGRGYSFHDEPEMAYQQERLPWSERRAARVLKTLADARLPLSALEISKPTEMTPVSLPSILQQIVKHGWAEVHSCSPKVWQITDTGMAKLRCNGLIPLTMAAE